MKIRLWHLSHLDAIFTSDLDQICGLPTGSPPCEDPQQHSHLFFKSNSWTRHKPRIPNIINTEVSIVLSTVESVSPRTLVGFQLKQLDSASDTPNSLSRLCSIVISLFALTKPCDLISFLLFIYKPSPAPPVAEMAELALSFSRHINTEM